MYTLVNGAKVDELRFTHGNGAWEISQFYYYNGELVQQAYNTETKELKVINAKGETLYTL